MVRSTPGWPARRGWWALGFLAAAALLWLVHGVLLRSAVLWLTGPVGRSLGGELSVQDASARLFRPLILSGVELAGADGYRWRADEARITWAGPAGWISGRWVELLSLDGLRLDATPGPGGRPGSHRAPAGGPLVTTARRWIPRAIECKNASCDLSGASGRLSLSGLYLFLSEHRPGYFHAREAELGAGGWKKSLANLAATTAWTDGTAYLSDLPLADDVLLAQVSVALFGRLSAALEARAFGGYVYASVARGESAPLQVSLTAAGLSVEAAGRFAGVDEKTAGRIGLAKLTFNGGPDAPLRGQVALRVEADGFAWGDRAFEQLAAGLSSADGRWEIHDFLLRQKANNVSMKGDFRLPASGSSWREMPLDVEVQADVGDLRALGALAGRGGGQVSGRLRVDASLDGLAGDGGGWVTVQGWKLRARGVPVDSVEAHLAREGRELKLKGLEAWSGKNFLRGSGAMSLDEGYAYKGRVEMRVRDLAPYVESLGRFAPDWAREGGALVFWDGDGAAGAHSGVVSLELVQFTGDLNPVPVNAKLAATYSPGNIYVSRLLLDRGPLSLSSTLYLSKAGLSAQGVQLFHGRNSLLRGELFLPVSLPLLLEKGSWSDALLAGADISAWVRSDNLELSSVAGLFGQDLPLEGRADLQLDATGPWENPAAKSLLRVDGLRVDSPALVLPACGLRFGAELKDRKIATEARLAIGKGEPIALHAVIPAISSGKDGEWSLVDHASPWQANLKAPDADLTGCGLRLLGLRLSGGRLAGSLEASNTLEEPRLDGTLEWKGGRVEFPGGVTPLSDSRLKLVFEDHTVRAADGGGSMGDGTLQVAGTVDFSKLREPSWDVSLKGDRLSLLRQDALEIVCSPDVRLAGRAADGKVDGSLDLAGTRALRRPLLIPRLVAPANPGAPAPGSTLAREPYASWLLNLRATAAAPLPLDGTGFLEPDLYLTGTLGAPLLLGTVRLKDTTLSFPKADLAVSQGAVHFTREFPWTPVLDLMAAGRVGPYDVRAGLFGPLPERRLAVSTTPPLAEEQMVMLLATGLSPSATALGGETEMAAPAKLKATPSWWDVDKILGLFGWSAVSGDGGSAAPADQVKLGTQPLGYDWRWR